jgi:hypothetical protein
LTYVSEAGLGEGTSGEGAKVTVVNVMFTVKVLADAGALSSVTVPALGAAVRPPQFAAAAIVRFTGVEVVAVPPLRGVIESQVGGAALEESTVNGVPTFDVDEIGTVTAGPGAYVVLPPVITVFTQVTV